MAWLMVIITDMQQVRGLKAARDRVLRHEQIDGSRAMLLEFSLAGPQARVLERSERLVEVLVRLLVGLSADLLGVAADIRASSSREPLWGAPLDVRIQRTLTPRPLQPAGELQAAPKHSSRRIDQKDVVVQRATLLEFEPTEVPDGAATVPYSLPESPDRSTHRALVNVVTGQRHQPHLAFGWTCDEAVLDPQVYALAETSTPPFSERRVKLHHVRGASLYVIAVAYV